MKKVVAMVLVGSLGVVALSGGFAHWFAGEGGAGEARCASRALKAAQREYRQRVKREMDAFEDRIKACARKEFDAVRAKIPLAVDAYGFKKCCALTKALATDKLKGSGSHAFEQAMDDDLGQLFYAPLLDARRAVLDERALLSGRLAEARRLYLAQSVAIEGLDDVSSETLAADSKEIESRLGNLYGAQLTAAVGTACEAAFIGLTFNSIRALLWPIACKVAGAVGIGVGSAVADGPIPVGDCIGAVVAVGGVAWSVADIRKAAKVLPGELRSALKRTVDTQERETVERALSDARKIVQAFEALPADVTKL